MSGQELCRGKNRRDTHLVHASLLQLLSPVLSHHDKSSKTQPPWCHCGLSIITKTTLYQASLLIMEVDKPICRSPSKKWRLVRLRLRENSDAHDVTEIRRCNWCCGLMLSIMIVTIIYDAASVNRSIIYIHKAAEGSWYPLHRSITSPRTPATSCHHIFHYFYHQPCYAIRRGNNPLPKTTKRIHRL